MPVDKFGRSPTTSQTEIQGFSLGYINNNFLRKGQMIDMNGKTITNLGSGQTPTDAVRKKHVSEKFFKNGSPVDMQNNPIKTVLAPVDEGDAANKSYVDSNSVGESDLDMGSHLVKNVGWPQETHDAANRTYVYFVANTKLSLGGGEMIGDINLNGQMKTSWSQSVGLKKIF